MNKINYQREMEKIIDNTSSDNKPKLLLHSCCGPCSSAVIERVAPHFQLTVFYYNPNIDTKAEYEYRAKEQIRLIEKMDLKHSVNVWVEEFTPQDYNRMIQGWENEPEGGRRCTKCFRLRLEKTALAAKANHFDFFTTTLSVSPHKNSQLLNQLGLYIGEKFGIAYLPSDFKKKGGYQRSVELSKQFEMYRQDYCGCVYSKQQSLEQKNEE